MSKKIKGAHDYEVARRFNRDEREIVRRKFSGKNADYPNEIDLDEARFSYETRMTERDDLDYLLRQGFEFPNRHA